MNICDQIKHDIAQEYYTLNYPNDGQRFVAWYLRNIYGLNTAEAKSCITDGAGDKQIDAVYINHEEETVYIIQGKYIQKGKIDAKPLMEIQAAWVQIKNLSHLEETANDILASKINDISAALDGYYDLCFELVTTSELTKSAQKDYGLFRQELSDNAELSASLVVVDSHVLEARYNDSIGLSSAGVTHSFTLEPGRYMDVNINGTRAVTAVIPLRDCVKIPGIQDGSLFRKNVRQALSKTTKVNKDIAQSLRENPGEFFFLHNGITAICSSLKIEGDTLYTEGLNVVNGCQSLTAIYSAGESLKKSGEGYIIFRFYEISDTARADVISTSTNSQNTVKPRDLRSNDKHILAMKKSFEQLYPDGLLITKRGEKAGPGKNPLHVTELATLGKMLISWHLQRPMLTHEESKIFSDNFKLLFHRQYTPENVQALSEIFRAIYAKWEPKNGNPLELNEELFNQKSYAPYWHLFAVSVLLSIINNQADNVPIPDSALKAMKDSGTLDSVVEMAGNCVNEAFMEAVDEAHDNGRVFNPPNWLKSSKTIIAIRATVRKRLKPYSPEEKKLIAELKEKLKMSKRYFEPVWTSD